MKIVTRTSLVFTLFSAAILLLFAFSIYYFSELNRQEEFVDRLGYKITWRAEFIFDAQLSEQKLRQLHDQNKKLINEAQITVYDADLYPVFTDIGEAQYPPEKLESVRSGKRFTWEEGDELYMGMQYTYENKTYNIIGHAYDNTGHEHIKQLTRMLIIIYLVAVVFIFFTSFLFARYILQPIKHIIHEIRDVSEHNLSKRVYYRKAKDELSELIQTFNTTFHRLETSFNNQRHFVSIISHEFRTPLTAMMAELELAKELNSTVEEYRKTIDRALEDAKEATTLSTALLDFARANYDSSQVTFSEQRLDELVIDAKLLVRDAEKDYRIAVAFDQSGLINSDADNEMLVYGNAYLLKVAFMNLMVNACKYSDGNCKVEIRTEGRSAILLFQDKGIGISPEDIPHIFDLFFRSESVGKQQGNGIGLSIVQRIIQMHQGEISVSSVPQEGSTFRVCLPLLGN
ncbi:ATP-binding protein [Sphingobacterium sp. Mn56C]|uniref:sensor histidine kinase n=1 Tax=Sphingobacterium sp. Mn56C TaxID=3395261 RepID=UPI003BC27B7D